MTNRELMDLLNQQHRLEFSQWVELFTSWQKEDLEYAMAMARDITDKRFGKKIYFRGIV